MADVISINQNVRHKCHDRVQIFRLVPILDQQIRAFLRNQAIVDLIPIKVKFTCNLEDLKNHQLYITVLANKVILLNVGEKRNRFPYLKSLLHLLID